MKKPTFLKSGFSILMLLLGFLSFAQNYVDFNPRFNQDLKGDIILIGNNILGPNNNAFNTNTTYNHDVNMQYIDIDGDATTFSSSSADLAIPNADCYQIKYAGLYWGAVTRGTESITNVKFKGPSGAYNNVVGTVIYDANGTKTGDSYPYACYADVTDIIKGLGVNNLGTYTVANVSSARGRTGQANPYNGTGLSAGWSLFVVYEDPTVPGKSITSFDGFSAISTAVNLDVPISGFRTLPAPIPVKANFAFAALEGDKPIVGDRLLLNGTALFTTDRPVDNFFNSSVTQLSATPVNNRNPNSTNTLGFDTGVMVVPNPGNAVIANSSTSAVVSLKSTGDTYFQYFFAFAVDIIEPKIILTKTVEDKFGNDIRNTMVQLGDELNYVIGFHNTGNDNATDLIIRDILPENIVFNYPGDIALLPSGVSIQSYNAATRELVFKVNNSEVEVGDPIKEIRFKATVVKTCSLLNDACSNLVTNQAFVTYKGTENSTFILTDDPSFSTNTGCLLTPGATNFLADLDCDFKENVILCGKSTVLTAGAGYDTYSWSTSPTGIPVIGTEQTLTVTKTGTYYSHNFATAPCQSIDQEYTVVTYGDVVINPITDFADQIVECPNDGKKLPNIFLCGGTDSRLIETNITDTSSIIWEKLDETSCDAVTIQDCANEGETCIWNQVGTGPNFLANTGGQFRLTLNYTGGCFSQFYFNVYQNLLTPDVTPRDIYCNTPGEIRVNGVPSGYEYSIDGTNFQPSNVFSITTPNIYTVYVKQVGVTSNPCVFTVRNIQIRDRDFSGSAITTQPLCHGEKGSVKLAANDVRPQYTYVIFQGGTEINRVGPILESDYTFSNLNPGSYTATISTQDGCTNTVPFTIVDPPLLSVTAGLTKPLTCTDGEITVYPVGGTPPYFYFVNSITDFQTDPKIVVTAAGTYNIKVFDSNNCPAETSIDVVAILAPEYTVSHNDILCYNSDTGEIQFVVTNANGYNIEYSIDNGITFGPNPTFSNLGTGMYSAGIKYSLNGTECFSAYEDIIITQPDTAVTASAGISALAGCGPSGEGKVRVTNPQGGVPPYKYSFDNQATWIDANEALVIPGTYTLYIKDANNCVFGMPQIILDPEPVAPTIVVNSPEFNCDGSANAIVTVTNPGSNTYTYTYLLDGVENTNTADPKIFLNVPDGAHTISVNYNLSTVSTYSNLLYENFGYGNDVQSPGINTTYYCFERQVVATQCNGAPNINDGDYSVTSSIKFPFGSWINPVDHTPPTIPATPKGRYLAVNIGATIPVTASLYEKEIKDIIPNQPINVELFAINLVGPGSTIFDPDLTVALVNAAGVEISSFSTGNIPKSGVWENYPKTPMTLNPGNNTELKFIVRSNVQQTDGNDVAIDDIRVYQLPVSCITKVDFPFIVDSGKKFTAEISNTSNTSCAGTIDGTITISAQNFDPLKGFQYSMDNGTTWNTTTTSPHTVTGLAAQTYSILVRYENVVDTCVVPLTQEIKAPTLLEVNATATPVTCLTGATITATATGGSPSFTYELLDASLALVQNFPANGILTNIPSGDYTIRATDVNSCTATTPLNIPTFTLPTATLVVSNYCYDAVTAVSIAVTAADGKAPYQYSINGSAFDSNNVFSNLTPGTYTIIVRDANGCTFTLPTETIENQLVISANLTKELDCTASPDATITGNFSGGYAPYTYAISINGAAYTNLPGNPFPYAAANAGTYRFRITDDKGCIAISDVITVNSIENPTATTTVVNASCNTNTNGSVQIVPSGGVGPYVYSFNGSGFTSTSLYIGLAAGTYAYQVRDAKNCIFDGSVTITEPTALVASASATTFSCALDNTKQTALVTIAVPTTGTAPYTYSFNGLGYTDTNTLTVNDNGTSQTISYSVKDANGCSAGNSVIIAPLNSPTDLTFNATTITCLATTATVTLTATNGVGVLQYETLAPSPIVIAKQTSNSFTGLTPGTYIFRVTDANGCYYTESLPINAVTNIAVIGQKLSDVLCNGDTTGAIRFTVSGYAGGYTSSISPSTGTLNQIGNTVNVTNLVAGTYTIEVTDNDTGCKDTETITISEPINALGVAAIATNVHCNNYLSQITITPTGGTAAYTYAVLPSGSPVPNINTGYATGNVVSVNTMAGTVLGWDVYVKDANNCTEKTTVTIISDPAPTVTAPVVANQCTVSSGFTFTVTTFTGVAPVKFSINGGVTYQDSPTFIVNAAGNYNIMIKDANGCTAVSSTDTQVFEALTVNTLLTKDITCFLPEEASINITVSGGKTPYVYEVSSNGGTSYTTISGSPYTTLTPGTYQFRITDANGCPKVTQGIIVNPIVYPEIISVVEGPTISCSSEETGSITITIDQTKGLAPFVINVLNTTTSTDYGTRTSGLAAGDYTITVTDAKGCTDTQFINIAQPAPIGFDLDKIDITCSDPGGSSFGSITVQNVAGGTAPFTYYITNNFGSPITGNPYTAATNEDHTFSIIDYGIYTINVIDANGCSLSKQITMASPPSDLVIDVTTSVVDCASGGTAIIESISAVGSGNYEFGILESNTSPYTSNFFPPDVPGGDIKTFTNLMPGVVYTFVVHDLTTDCYFVKAADTPIAPSSPLTSTVVPNNVVCQGENNGSVTFTIDNFDISTTSIDYTIYQAFTNNLISGPTNLPVTFGTAETVTTPVPGSLGIGQYYIGFKENGSGVYNGCESASLIFEIKESSIDLSISTLVSKNENCNELGIVSAKGINGTAPYQYQVVATTVTPDPTMWSGVNTYKLPAGTYDVYVRDAYGCEKFETKTIIKDDEPTINPVPQQCFDGTPLSITLTGTTFSSIVTYSIGGGFQSSPTFPITAAGTYTLSIKDANGCLATDTFVVNPPLTLDVTAAELDCVVTPVVFNFTPNGGTGTYSTYEVNYNNGGYVPASSSYTATVAGSYQFKVIDSQGCEAESTVVVVDPAVVPTHTTSKVDVTCNSSADGRIVITAVDGVAPFEYSIDGGANFLTTNIFTGLAGSLTGTTYQVVVRDSKNCVSLPTPVIIFLPTALVTTASATPFTCAIDNSPQASVVTIVEPTTGTAPYLYSFNGAGFTTTRTLTVNDNGTIQTINYEVKDANGCIFPDVVTISPLAPPTDLSFTNNPITCNDPLTDVTLATTNGAAPLSFEIISPLTATGNISGATSGIFTGLGPDTYVFTVTDANGCFYTEAYTIKPVTNITVSGALVNDVVCNTESNGAVTFTVGDFATTYSYTINGVPTGVSVNALTIPLTGLPIGNQIIVVTDDTTGCTATATVLVSQPTLVALTELPGINANCNFGAQVKVQGSGGIAPYQYAFVLDGSTPILSNYTDSDNAVLDPATSINWDVWVMDENGCTAKIDVVIATDPLPTVTVPPFAINQCTVAAGFEFTVTNPTGIAPFEYSIGQGFTTNPTFTVATAGTYSVTIRDGNNCINAVPVTIDIYPALALTPNITTLPSCADNDGVITVTGAGGSGTGNYTYSVAPALGSVSGNVISGLPAGTYTVTITDTVTGCSEDGMVTLAPPTPVVFTTTPTDVSCNGGNDGTIKVNLPPSNDNPIYTYEITAGPSIVASQTNNLFTGLVAGVYTVQVTSGRVCIANEDVTVGEADPIVVTAPVVVDFACNAGTNTNNLAIISVTNVIGGSGNYTKYEFIRGGVIVQTGTSNVYKETNLLGGTYTINVYDDKGCLGTQTATILPFIAMDDLNIAITNAITCTNDEDILVSVTSIGGTPTNLEFVLEDYAVTVPMPTQTNTTGIFSGLPIGNYKITVTNLDTGCSLAKVHYVGNPNTFDLIIYDVVDVTCFDGNDGSVQVTFIDRSPSPTDDSGPFNYTVVDALSNIVDSGSTANAGPITIPSLTSGTYTITATLANSPYCDVTKNFTITGPNAALVAFETHTEITCVTGNNDGTISASATGGWPGGYEYQLELPVGNPIVPFSATSNFQGLTQGNYVVSVRDSKGCIAVVPVSLMIPPPIVVNAIADVTVLTCFGDTSATITGSASGGQGSNFVYTLNKLTPTLTSSGPQLSPVFSGLGAGTYNISVTDGYNCAGTSANIIIAEPLQVESTLVKAISQTCLLDTELTLTATGGTGLYEYSVNASFSPSLGTFASSTTIIIPQGVAGTFKYYVRDAQGCEANVSNDIIIEPFPILDVTLDVTNAKINCDGDQTGVIIATAQGGLGNYVYTLQDGSGIAIPSAVQNSPGVFTDLSIGTYTIRVDSGDCIYTTTSVVIAPPANPLVNSFVSTDVTCSGSNNGMLVITSTGGTGNIKYAVSPRLDMWVSDGVFENLKPGIYQAIAQDELGCYEIYDFEITEPSPVIVALVPNSIVPEICTGDLDGEFSITISGGTAPYSYVLDDSNGAYTLGVLENEQVDFSGLAGGDHIVFVKDALDCTSEWNITFPESVSLVPVAKVEFDCTDNAFTNTVTVSAGPSVTDLSALDYSLDGVNYQPSNIFNNVPIGFDQVIMVRHTNGCEKPTAPFDIEPYSPLAILLQDGGLNEIVAVATGGNGNYEYALNGVSYGTTSTFIIYKSGDYTVTVTDAYGCYATATRYFEHIDVCIPNYFTPNDDGNQDEWGPGCTSQYKDLTFDIFDRYGRKLASMRYGQKWDGKYNGVALPTGDYWYVLRLNDIRDNREFVGHFTLYR